MSDRQFDDLDLNYTPLLPADREAMVLDVGCGSGRVLAFLQARGYRNLEGFDRDPDAVAAARSRTSARLAVSDDWNSVLANRDSAFDVVVLKEVVYSVPQADLVGALAAVGRALKPGGRVIVEVFNGVAATGPFVAYKDEDIRWIPTEQTIRRVLERAGLTAISLHAQRAPSQGLRRRLFNLAAAAWRGVLRMIYFAERGLAEENPRIFTTKIIATATRPGGSRNPL